MPVNERTAADLLDVELVDVDFEVDERVVIVRQGEDVAVVIGTHGGIDVRAAAHKIIGIVGGSCVIDVHHAEIRPILGLEGKGGRTDGA